MAQPIPFELPKRDSREELKARLEQAPAEHAEAVLAAFEVLQGLHDRGILELLRGALGGSDKILELVVDASKSPDAIRGMRNLLILSKTLGSIDPDLLQKYAAVIPAAIESAAEADRTDPPGFWEALRIVSGRNMRRGLAMLNGVMAAFRD